MIRREAPSFEHGFGTAELDFSKEIPGFRSGLKQLFLDDALFCRRTDIRGAVNHMRGWVVLSAAAVAAKRLCP